MGRKTKLATIILIDKSIPMSGDGLPMALGASWCVRKALEETDNKVSEIAFDQEHIELKDWFGKPNYNIWASGGTDPNKALYIASPKIRDICQYNDELNPLVILITDGQYDPQYKDPSTGYSSQDMVERLQKMGAKVAEITLSGREKTFQIEGNREKIFDYQESCPDPDGLPIVMEGILEDMQKGFIERYSYDGRWR